MKMGTIIKAPAVHVEVQPETIFFRNIKKRNLGKWTSHSINQVSRLTLPKFVEHSASMTAISNKQT